MARKKKAVEAQATADVNEFDLAFVVDTTGSMGGFLEVAKRNMIDIIDEVSQQNGINIRVGVVEYRDHSPQDSLPSRSYEFTGDKKSMQQNIKNLHAAGGGDGPESVFDGLVAGCKLSWRKHSRRIAILVGDAPPHGVGAPGDGFPKGCPCGENPRTVTSQLEGQSITLYAIPLTNDARKYFEELAKLTGGKILDESSNAIKEIKSILEHEFSHLPLDRKVLQTFQKETTPSEIAKLLDESESIVLASMSRLGSRGLLDLSLVGQVA